MKRFREFITELFDKPYKWKMVSSVRKANWRADFTTDDGFKYSFIASEEAPENWSVVFSLENLPGRRAGVMDISGTGDAFRVFATVREIFTKFAAEKTPNFISYSSQKNVGTPARQKIYDRFAKQFGRKNDYDVEVVGTKQSTYFIFTKKGLRK